MRKRPAPAQSPLRVALDERAGRGARRVGGLRLRLGRRRRRRGDGERGGGRGLRLREPGHLRAAQAAHRRRRPARARALRPRPRACRWPGPWRSGSRSAGRRAPQGDDRRVRSCPAIQHAPAFQVKARRRAGRPTSSPWRRRVSSACRWRSRSSRSASSLLSSPRAARGGCRCWSSTSAAGRRSCARPRPSLGIASRRAATFGLS